MTSKRLLLIEDDPVVADMICDVLLRSDIRVQRVDTLAAAQAQLDEGQFDLLLLDYLLPDGSAFDLLDRYSFHPEFPPFVILTGAGDEKIAVEMMKRGARDYLVKDSGLLACLPVAMAKVFRALELEQQLQQTRANLQQKKEILRRVAEEVSTTIGADFLQRMLGFLVETLEAKHSLVGELNATGTMLHSLVRSRDSEMLQRFERPFAGTPCDTVYRVGELWCCNDRLQDVYPECVLVHDLDAQGYMGIPLRHANGVIFGIMAVFWQDQVRNVELAKNLLLIFASRVAAELERQQVMARLQEQESHLLQAQELGKIASFDWDLGSSRIDWTPEGYAILERPRGSIEQTVEGWLACVHPADLANLHTAIQQALQGKIDYAAIDYRLVMPDGRNKYVSTRAEVVRDVDHLPVRILGVTQDLSERILHEVELDEARQRAEAASRAKTEFLANMSHELRTPLNGLLGMLQLLENTPLAEEQRDYVTTASRSSWSLLGLLNDLLDLSRIEAGRMELCEEPFVVRELVDNCLALFSQSVRDKGLGLTVEIDPALPPQLSGDQTRIRQILFNLLGNAVKFTQSGEVRISVSLHAQRAEQRQQLRLQVADTGIGMAPEVQGRVFEPFVREEGVYQRKFEGVGLGLSIVKRLVELMHGEIALVSTRGVGTTVTVTIEVGNVLMRSEAVPAARPTAAAADRSLRILVAEDNAVNRLLLVRMLEKSGHRVTVAEDGLQVLDALRTTACDLLLLDIQMPELDGLEVTRRIRHDQSGVFNPHLPIVAVTAYAMPSEQAEFLAAGLDDCLTKPVSMASLHTMLAKFTPAGGENAVAS